MGIPHLITALEPYAELQELEGQEIVLDGPAFAYHIYYLCLGTKKDARGPSEAAPSYAEISRTAIEWLGALHQNGLQVKKIYFDGFLPPAKRDVRLSRLVGLTRRMSDYYYANQTVNISSTRHNAAATSFGTFSISPRLTALPPPPFLVPTVLESLLGSAQFKNLTLVVPGEADLYCSQYLNQHGGVVLTGDSDLLVHNLGPDGKVGFFKDIRMVGSGTLKCQIYWPSTIAERLSLPPLHGLKSLAFEMKTDPHSSFKELLSRAKDSKAINSHATSFEEFEKDYQTLLGDVTQPVDANSARSVLQTLDARISEYVLQSPQVAALAGQRTEESSSDDTHIFLPFLIDSPTKTSAWELSSSIRQLAYSVMNLVVHDHQQKEYVFEHKKQTDKSNGRKLQLASALGEIEDACAATAHLIAQVRDKLPAVSDRDFWIALAIYQDVEFANANSKSPLTATVKRQIPDGKLGRNMSWDVVQFFAQIQASYYSFRMLKQISSLVIALNTSSNIPKSLFALVGLSSSLPSLSSLHELSEIGVIVQFINESKVYEIVCGMLGIQSQISATQEDDVKASKRKRKRDQAAAVKRHTKSNNPFALLGAD